VPTTSAFAHIQDQADDSDILPLVIFPLEQMFGQTQLLRLLLPQRQHYIGMAKFTRNSVNPSQQITPCGSMMILV
jgi:hypothetical protein